MMGTRMITEGAMLIAKNHSQDGIVLVLLLLCVIPLVGTVIELALKSVMMAQMMALGVKQDV